MDRVDIERDMDAYMEDDLPPLPDDLDTAAMLPVVPPDNDWAVQATMRRVRRHSREAATISDVAKVEIDRLTRWRDDRVNALQRAIDWDTRALEAYMRGQAEAPNGKRTIKLADGTLTLRPHRGTVDVTDPAAFLAWALHHDPIDRVDGSTATPQELWLSELSLDDRSLDGKWHLGLLRVTVEPAKTALAGLDHPGFDADGVAPLSLPGGELVPGVQLRKDPTDTFNATPTKD